MRTLLRAVYDSNIYISGTFWRGVPRRVLELARRGEVKVSISLPILMEISRTLRGRKFGLSQDEVDRILREILSFAARCTPRERLDVVKVDPDDNKVLECAVASRAQYVVSSDHHLTDLKEYGGIKILRADEFLRTCKEVGVSQNKDFS